MKSDTIQARVLLWSDAEISWEILPEEDVPPEDCFDDKKMLKNTLEGIDSGKYLWCCVKVTVSWGGFEGWSTLGGVLLEPGQRDPIDIFKEEGFGHEDMVQSAKEDLISKLEEAGWKFKYFIEEAELIMLLSATSSRDWDATCDIIKKRCGGDYPSDWYSKVIESGLYNTARKNFRNINDE